MSNNDNSNTNMSNSSDSSNSSGSSSAAGFYGSSGSSGKTQGDISSIPKSSGAALISLAIFIVITLLFFSLRSFLMKKSSKLITTFIYFGIVVITQYVSNLSAMHKICNNWQYGPVFFITFMPWLLIFGVIVLAITYMPSWLIPFSNTFGYAAAKLSNLNSILKKLTIDPEKVSGENTTKTKLSDDQRKTLDILYFITKDPSLIINELTCFTTKKIEGNVVCRGNFDTLYDKLTNVVFKPILTDDDAKYKERLRKMVQLKETVSEAIWYLLFGSYTVMITNMTIVNSGCNTSTALMRERYAKYKEEVKKVKDNTAPNRVFIHRS